MKIPLNLPLSPDKKLLGSYIEKIHSSQQLTNFGPLHRELTDKLQDYLDVQNLLLVSNGTLGLHVAYRALAVESAICTPFSFIATASSLHWEKIKTTFADIDEKTLNISPGSIRNLLARQDQHDCIVATHVYGNPCDLDELEAIQRFHKKKLIFDAAHAFSVKRNGKSILSSGDASVLSFHATKLFHTIEGGAVVFKDSEHFERAKKIINFGQINESSPPLLGINAKLNEYQAAVGLCLLDDIDQVIGHRVELYERYKKGVCNLVELQAWDADSSLNGAYFPILVEDEFQKADLKAWLHDHGVASREYFYPSLNSIFDESQECPVSEQISRRVLCLPLHYALSIKDIDYVISIIEGYYR